MGYTIDINNSIDALTYCLNKVNSCIDSSEWRISVNAGGIDYGVYFNFDLDNKELEISNQPTCGYDDSLCLEEILDEISEDEEEE